MCRAAAELLRAEEAKAPGLGARIGADVASFLADKGLALNAEQKRQWAVDGYLQLPQVLSADEVAVLSAQVDDFRAKPGYEPADHPQGHYLWMNHCEDLESTGFMDRRHLLAYHHAFIDLIDRPGIFDRIVDLDGTNQSSLGCDHVL